MPGGIGALSIPEGSGVVRIAFNRACQCGWSEGGGAGASGLGVPGAGDTGTADILGLGLTGTYALVLGILKLYVGFPGSTYVLCWFGMPTFGGGGGGGGGGIT